MAIIPWPTRPYISTCRSWRCARRRRKNWNTATCMAPAGTTTRRPLGQALQKFEQRQALRQREGLQSRAQGGVLLSERGDGGCEIQALQGRNRLRQLRLRSRCDRLLRGDRIEASTDGRAHVGTLAQRLVDVVDRGVDRIVQTGGGSGAAHTGLQRRYQVLHCREQALIG